MLTKTIFAAAFGAALVMPVCAFAAADVGAEISTAADHAGYAAAAPNLAQIHMHLHHAVNCLVGPKDKNFDATNMNPCAKSGDGAIPDESDAAVKVKLEAAVTTAEAGIASSDEAAAKKDAGDVQTALKAIK